MTICPVAIAVGCKKCPVFKVCPAKSTLGDFREADEPPKGSAAADKSSDKKD